METKPHYDAPWYKGNIYKHTSRRTKDIHVGSGKLQDKVAIVTGGDSGIGRSVCTLYAREGCDIVCVYLDEHDDANITKKAVEKEGRRCHLIPGVCALLQQRIRERTFPSDLLKLLSLGLEAKRVL
jgi:hypothetical protein